MVPKSESEPNGNVQTVLDVLSGKKESKGSSATEEKDFFDSMTKRASAIEKRIDELDKSDAILAKRQSELEILVGATSKELEEEKKEEELMEKMRARVVDILAAIERLDTSNKQLFEQQTELEARMQREREKAEKIVTDAVLQQPDLEEEARVNPLDWFKKKCTQYAGDLAHAPKAFMDAMKQIVKRNALVVTLGAAAVGTTYISATYISDYFNKTTIEKTGGNEKDGDITITPPVEEVPVVNDKTEVVAPPVTITTPVEDTPVADDKTEVVTPPVVFTPPPFVKQESTKVVVTPPLKPTIPPPPSVKVPKEQPVVRPEQVNFTLSNPKFNNENGSVFRLSENAQRIMLQTETSKDFGTSYLVVDKPSGLVTVVDKNNRIVGQFSCLRGAAIGDYPNTADLNSKRPGKGATTPPGLRIMRKTENPHEVKLYNGNAFVLIDPNNPGEVRPLGLHTPFPGEYKERMHALSTPTKEDDYKTWGCINVSKENFAFLESVLGDGKESFVYITPETPGAYMDPVTGEVWYSYKK